LFRKLLDIVAVRPNMHKLIEDPFWIVIRPRVVARPFGKLKR